MTAVIDRKASMLAFCQGLLCTFAPEVVKQNLAFPLAIVGLVFGHQSRPAFHLAARNLCLL